MQTFNKSAASTDLYPYVLQPKLAPAIWGSESWECWDANRVANGSLAGRSVAELRHMLGAALLGDLDAAQIFPILTKIIDACDSLSVQVHPDDAYARRVEHQQNGKTECWYILHAEPEAELVLGWARDTSREEYERRVADCTLGEILRRVKITAGQAVYLPAGLLHAIGAGIVLFETQQASDLTYRIFDWNRTGPDGKPRDLHVQKAADVLDYRCSEASALETLAYAAEGFQRTALIADDHFLVERIIATEAAASLSTHDRPVIIMSLKDELRVSCNGSDVALRPYQTALVPAAAKNVAVSSANGAAPFMCVTPPVSSNAVAQRFRDAGVAQPMIERFLMQF